MIDFLGQELQVGDDCVFMKDTKTGVSARRKCFYHATIKGFSSSKVIFDIDKDDKKLECRVFPRDIVKLTNNRQVCLEERKRILTAIREYFKNNKYRMNSDMEKGCSMLMEFVTALERERYL